MSHKWFGCSSREAYFNHEGEFRGTKPKGKHLGKLLALQTVKKFEKSILFIRRELEPYKHRLAFRPSTEPEQMVIALVGRRSAPTILQSVMLNGQELTTEACVSHAELWALSHKPFTASKLRQNLAAVWFADPSLIDINIPEGTNSSTKFQLPEGVQIGYPGGTEE